jgi:prepilin-type processing-associated H-X9-DG protein
LPDGLGVNFPNNWGSAHSGGVPFLYCDGSERLIAFTTSPSVIHELLTPQGGEVNDAY